MLTKDTKKLLLEFGIKPAYRGFKPIIYGTSLLQEHPEYLNHITKDLYPEIVKRCDTTMGSVERNIRTVIELLWKRCGAGYFRERFNYDADKRPTNTEFFRILLENYGKDYEKHDREAAATLEEIDDCLECHRSCPKLNKLKEKIASLEAENQWMHDLIWSLMRDKEI